MQVRLNQLNDRYQKLTTPANVSFRQCQNITKDTWTKWIRLNFEFIGPATSSCITKEIHDTPGELNNTHLFHNKCSTSRPHLWSFGEVDSTNASVDGPALMPYSGCVHIDDRARMTNLNGILNIFHIPYLYPHKYVRILPVWVLASRESRLLGDVMNVINAMMLQAYDSN